MYPKREGEGPKRTQTFINAYLWVFTVYFLFIPYIKRGRKKISFESHSNVSNSRMNKNAKQRLKKICILRAKF